MKEKEKGKHYQNELNDDTHLAIIPHAIAMQKFLENHTQPQAASDKIVNSAPSQKTKAKVVSIFTITFTEILGRVESTKRGQISTTSAFKN